jgi:hypothetical protein
MQITLKVKSTESLGASSPTMTVLAGSLKWQVMYLDGRVGDHDQFSKFKNNIQVTPSLSLNVAF